MKLGSKSKRNVPIAFLVAAGLAVAAVAAYVALVRPQNSKADELQTKVESTDSQIAAVQKILNQPERPNNLIKVADLVELAKAMPDENNIAAAILELDAEAKSAGVEFTGVAPGIPVPGSGYTQIPLSLSFVGNYYDLTELVYRLRQLVTVRDGTLHATGRLFTIDSVNWHEPTLEHFPTVQADLVISTYVYGVNPALLPGGTVPGSTTPATTTPGATSTTPGATTPGATAPASTTPGQTSTGPAATTSPADGAQQAAAGATP